MRLKFSVLWFDDNEVYLDSVDLDGLKGDVRSWGFDPEITMVTTPEEFAYHMPFEKFDLIVVDRRLENYPDGQDFIAELRNHAVYTEVIFYTAGNASDLWDAIREKQLEGVFVSNRNDILSKITRIGYQSIRKVLDLENMRGIVMAEVGELDHLLDDIITIGMSSLSAEQQNSIFTKFHTESIKQSQQSQERLHAFLENPAIIEMLNLCDSSKRWQNFNRLWKQHEKLRSRGRVGEFDKDVLGPRNFLAHGRPLYRDDGSVLFSHQGREYLFNADNSLKLRQTILQYKVAFSEIRTILRT